MKKLDLGTKLDARNPADYKSCIVVRVQGREASMNNNSLSVGIAVQADWDNRQFSNSLALNVRRLFEFLLQFETTTRSKLASLNEKLATLE